MSTSFYVEYTTDKFDRMIAIKKACDAAGIKVPEEVEKYLRKIGYDGYREECADECRWEKMPEEAVTGNSGCEETYVVDLSKVPKGTTKVRFKISW